MKTLKRIIYSLLGLLLTSVVVLAGFILYAEYSGRSFSPIPDDLWAKSGGSANDSRLTYDEHGNLAELPKGMSAAASDAEGGTESSRPAASSDTPAPLSDGTSTDTAVVPAGESIAPMPAPSDNGTASSELEFHYIMDMGSNLFHYETCDYAANIADENYSAKTTTRDKIINAGYEACPNCNP